jgi:hypothetical protein
VYYTLYTCLSVPDLLQSDPPRQIAVPRPQVPFTSHNHVPVQIVGWSWWLISDLSLLLEPHDRHPTQQSFPLCLCRLLNPQDLHGLLKTRTKVDYTAPIHQFVRLSRIFITVPNVSLATTPFSLCSSSKLALGIRCLSEVPVSHIRRRILPGPSVATSRPCDTGSLRASSASIGCLSLCGAATPSHRSSSA